MDRRRWRTMLKARGAGRKAIRRFAQWNRLPQIKPLSAPRATGIRIAFGTIDEIHSYRRELRNEKPVKLTRYHACIASARRFISGGSDAHGDTSRSATPATRGDR